MFGEYDKTEIFCHKPPEVVKGEWGDLAFGSDGSIDFLMG
jgi:hypothetical protein